MQISKFSFPNVTSQVIVKQVLPCFPDTVKDAESPSSEPCLSDFLLHLCKFKIHIPNSACSSPRGMDINEEMFSCQILLYQSAKGTGCSEQLFNFS
jgi:hypothetical protein